MSNKQTQRTKSQPLTIRLELAGLHPHEVAAAIEEEEEEAIDSRVKAILEAEDPRGLALKMGTPDLLATKFLLMAYVDIITEEVKTRLALERGRSGKAL